MPAQQSALTRLLDWAAGQVATIRSSHVNQHTGQIDDEEIREEVEQVEDDMKALDGVEERIRKLECDLGSTLVRAESAEQKLAEMREENRGLRQDTLTLERRGDRLEAALQIVDRHMSGNDSYEGIWVNYPDKPEQSPASVVREAIHAADRWERFWADELDRALAQSGEGRVPEGWKLVPVEPTPEMIANAVSEIDRHNAGTKDGSFENSVRVAYYAFLAAAPEPDEREG